MGLDEHSATIDGRLTAWRAAPVRDGGSPIVWVHGVPDSSAAWTPFLERAGGVALDLPGFGRSGKPADGPYSPSGLADAVQAFVAHLGLERYRLVVHDWGVVGLIAAAREPERVERIVALDVVPLDGEYRWHRVARVWRTPVAGEVAMGATTAWAMRRGSGLPRPHVDEVMRHFDHGTQRAILKLYRSADREVLSAAAAGLDGLRAPALVLWGERDPYLPARFARRLADSLAGPADVEVLSELGHWPWTQDPGVVDRVLRFLAGRSGS